MNFIIWNARGANSATFRRQCDAMVKVHKSAILVLLETKITKHKRLTKELRFDAQIQSLLMGLRGDCSDVERRCTEAGEPHDNDASNPHHG
ncbi:hypothetical protein R3W88_008133 [Solanum pinnatisectum]|uniref:Uncharacterized protein n=1 Tax=Solanum pinnatisectum TaxID=50273 RepID=A0AAV9MAW2_9SOLN|nr:hypothetical protein R3W88_008133 [Solanum pinnatisectum]